MRFRCVHQTREVLSSVYAGTLLKIHFRKKRRKSIVKPSDVLFADTNFYVLSR